MRPATAALGASFAATALAATACSTTDPSPIPTASQAPSVEFDWDPVALP